MDLESILKDALSKTFDYTISGEVEGERREPIVLMIIGTIMLWKN